MECNEGKPDRIIRAISAVIIAAIIYVYNLSAWWYLIALVPAVTAITGFCGLYPLLGINTCKKKKI
jgi:predicted RND superfamily exporter protein